jgi:hypothetical protein
VCECVCVCTSVHKTHVRKRHYFADKAELGAHLGSAMFYIESPSFSPYIESPSFSPYIESPSFSPYRISVVLTLYRELSRTQSGSFSFSLSRSLSLFRPRTHARCVAFFRSIPSPSRTRSRSLARSLFHSLLSTTDLRRIWSKI